MNEMNKPKTTRYEDALYVARFHSTDEEEVKRIAKHLFARMISGGATIGKVNGKIVINKERIRPKLP